MAIIDVVKFDGLKNRDWVIYKHPTDSLVFGTQLIVGEGQAAIFVNGGKVCDTFPAGTYTLDTKNLPVLQGIVNLPFGRKTPFPAEIYFVNLTAKLDMQWGTSTPIQVIDPKYYVKLRIRAFGQFGLKIEDYKLFFTEIIGAMQMADAVRYDKVMSYYKGIIVTKIKSVIANVMINQKISALEISAKLEELSSSVNEALRSDIQSFGFRLVNFFIHSINFPDEDFAEINKILGNKAAFEIMGDNRYVTQRSFDVYETAAGNTGGVAGAFAAGGVGFGAGTAIASSMQQNLNIAAPAQQNQNQIGVKCHSCGAVISGSLKFCGECGASLAGTTCTCGAGIPAGAKFCSQCGKKEGEA